MALSDEEEERLHEHYGEGSKIVAGGDGPEVVRSEEEVDFGTGPMKPKERVRLKKHTVVEHVEKTVPVRREEIRLEHEGPPESGRVIREEKLD